MSVFGVCCNVFEASSTTSVDPDQTAPVDPDQTAPVRAVLSGSTLFASNVTYVNL